MLTRWLQPWEKELSKWQSYHPLVVKHHQRSEKGQWKGQRSTNHPDSYSRLLCGHWAEVWGQYESSAPSPRILNRLSCGAGTCGDWPILSRQSKAINFSSVPFIYSLDRVLALDEVKGRFFFPFQWPASPHLKQVPGRGSSVPIIFSRVLSGASRSLYHEKPFY